MMYDELIKKLRIGTKDFPGYIVYPDGGVQPFYLTSKDLEQAADAIEGLELRCKNFEEALNELDEKLDELQYSWIPVTERLPEPCETVLAFRVFGVHGQLSEVCFAHTLKMFDRINWSMVGVTHWMPLPEPPKEHEA